MVTGHGRCGAKPHTKEEPGGRRAGAAEPPRKAAADMPTELELAGRLGAALVLGGAIGLERELTGQVAGLRTHMSVALGAALFGLISTRRRRKRSAERLAAGLAESASDAQRPSRPTPS